MVLICSGAIMKRDGSIGKADLFQPMTSVRLVLQATSAPLIRALSNDHTNLITPWSPHRDRNIFRPHEESFGSPGTRYFSSGGLLGAYRLQPP